MSSLLYRFSSIIPAFQCYTPASLLLYRHIASTNTRVSFTIPAFPVPYRHFQYYIGIFSTTHHRLYCCTGIASTNTSISVTIPGFPLLYRHFYTPQSLMLYRHYQYQYQRLRYYTRISSTIPIFSILYRNFRYYIDIPSNVPALPIRFWHFRYYIGITSNVTAVQMRFWQAAGVANTMTAHISFTQKLLSRNIIAQTPGVYNTPKQTTTKSFNPDLYLSSLFLAQTLSEPVWPSSKALGW